MPGLETSDYMATVAKQGQKFTAISEHAADSAEFEIVKGRESDEVELDLDPRTGLATDVEVDTNGWQSRETERAPSDE